jgi:AAA+ ATPase superfamily predicted ATPase
MENPFKFGTVVDGNFFTDRTKELIYVKSVLNSENHIVLISPRRFGKTSLVIKAAKETDRPVLFLNLESVTDKRDFAVAILKHIFKLFPFEKVKHMMRNFRFVPTLSMSAIGDSIDISFVPQINEDAVLEDSFALLERVAENGKIIVIFDEFQSINEIAPRLDKQLRAIMQMQKNINYVLLGSQESMMREIFEQKRSPFYHFGTLMTLNKIPYDDFSEFIEERLPEAVGEYKKDVVTDILAFTDCHPYYTQKLAFHVWDIIDREGFRQDVVNKAIEISNYIHDNDYERLWISLNKTDKRVMRYMAMNPRMSSLAPASLGMATSTIYSSLKRLVRSGLAIKTDTYIIDDPFFAEWIKTRM